MTRPDRRVVTIDGTPITVVQRNADHWDAVFMGVAIIHEILTLKEKEIAAVEQVTGCKVVACEFMPDSVILNTRVDCLRPQ
jgi:hypothetical protein